MKTSHKLFIASVATVPMLAAVPVAVRAATDTNAQTNHMQSLVDKLATKFNLKTADVQAVFDEERTARQAQMKTKVSAALKTAGFSDAQITAWQTKMDEQRDSMKAWRDANPNATADERKAHRDAEKTELEAWAKTQGIDLTKLHDALKTAGVGPMGGRGHGMRMGQTSDAPVDAPAN